MEINVCGLCKNIKGTEILSDVNITLNSGKVYGLRGKNGSGKTMFMRALCGLILPTKGKIEIDGKILGRDMDFPESVGVLIESPSFLKGYTGLDNLKMLASIRSNVDEKSIRTSMEMVGLNPDDSRTYRKYSLGMKQRLGIACAIMESPELILLDEPINALDQSGVQEIRDVLMMLKQEGKLIVVACHDNEELEYLSDIIFHVEDGRVELEG